MDEERKIAYNCRKATFLIEKKQLSTITVREQFELKLHLAGCSVCRLFEQQSANINRAVKDIFNSNRHVHRQLDDDYKTNLQNLIKERISNK